MQNLLDKFEKVFSEQTKGSSTVSRQIVFALIALIWAISYDKGILKVNYYTLFSLLFLLVFLILDIVQSLVSSTRYRKIFYTVREAIRNKVPLEKEEENKILSYCDKTDELTYKILVIKIGMIPISLIGILLELIRIVK